MRHRVDTGPKRSSELCPILIQRHGHIDSSEEYFYEFRVVVDLDPRASASVWLGAPSGGRQLLELLLERDRNSLPTIRQLTAGLDLIPCALLLTQFDPRTAQRPGRDLRPWHALDRLPAERWDYTFSQSQLRQDVLPHRIRRDPNSPTDRTQREPPLLGVAGSP